MNIISLCGLIPYIVLSFVYHSQGMFIIAINGILFHIFPNNRVLYAIDLTTNTYLYIRSTINYFYIFKYAVFSLFVFLLNNHFCKNKKILCEIIHVLFVQWISLYAITSVYYRDKCFPLLFLC